MKPFKWGILGAGRIARKFANDLESISDATLYAVGSRSMERAQSFANDFGAPKAYGSYEAFVQDKEIDAVYIASRHVQHCENTLLCLQHKLPVLCEKPFAMDKEQVQQMIDEANKQDVFLMEALWSRFLPAIRKAKEIADGGAIGQVKGISADFGFKAAFDPNGRLYNHKLGGGALLDIGIYPIFLALLIKGMPAEMKATAHIGKTHIDEQCAILFKYNDGAIANLTATILSDTPKVGLIHGELGNITIHPAWHKADSIQVDYHDGRKESYDFPRSTFGYQFEAIEVMNCLAKGEKQSSLWSHQDSLNLIELLDQARQQIGLSYKLE